MATENTDTQKLIVSSSPHIRKNDSIPMIMWAVFIALIPAGVWGVYNFGIEALFHILICVISCVVVDLFIIGVIKKQKRSNLNPGPAAVTGLLLAFVLPVQTPYFVDVIGSIFAIAIAKQAFGGTGNNIVNPALAGRAVIIMSFGSQLGSYANKFIMSSGAEASGATVDVSTYATPLAALKLENPAWITDLWDLFLGKVGGTIGEVSALFLLLGAIYLFARKIITWEIPVSYIGSFTAVILLLGLFGVNKPESMNILTFVLYHLLSGGLILGAFYMATDMVTSPVTPKGQIIFGIGCGLLTVIFRIWTKLPEGVMFAILIMNLFVPLIDKYVNPRIFGKSKKKTEEKEA